MADNKDVKLLKGAPADQGGKKKKLMIIGGAALLLLIILGAAAFFIMKKAPAKEENHGEKPAAETQAPPLHPPQAIGPMVEIKEFIVNIISEGEKHYVKASLTIELIAPAATGAKEGGGGHGGGAAAKDPATEEATQRMPQIRDSILMLIGNKTYEELQDLQGKKQLKAELTSKLNSILHVGKVKEIYFTDFVVQ